MALLALCGIILLGLIMIPFGLPGTLVIFCGAIGYTLLVPGSISWFTVGVIGAMMVTAEVIEWALTARFTKRYGGGGRPGGGGGGRVAARELGRRDRRHGRRVRRRAGADRRLDHRRVRRCVRRRVRVRIQRG